MSEYIPPISPFSQLDEQEAQFYWASKELARRSYLAGVNLLTLTPDDIQNIMSETSFQTRWVLPGTVGLTEFPDEQGKSDLLVLDAFNSFPFKLPIDRMHAFLQFLVLASRVNGSINGLRVHALIVPFLNSLLEHDIPASFGEEALNSDDIEIRRAAFWEYFVTSWRVHFGEVIFTEIIDEHIIRSGILSPKTSSQQSVTPPIHPVNPPVHQEVISELSSAELEIGNGEGESVSLSSPVVERFSDEDECEDDDSDDYDRRYGHLQDEFDG